ncbi:hypothetical protein AAZV13_15G100200 [Glycine max]
MLPSLHHFKVQELVDGVLYNIGAAGSYNFKHVIKGLRYWYGSIRRQCFMISKLSYLIEPCQYHMQTLIMACNNWQLANTLKVVSLPISSIVFLLKLNFHLNRLDDNY